MTQIHITVHDVTEGWVELDGIDTAATTLMYAAVLEERLQAAFPDADVTVDALPNRTGPTRDHITAGDYDTTESAREHVALIVQALTEDYDAYMVVA